MTAYVISILQQLGTANLTCQAIVLVPTRERAQYVAQVDLTDLYNYALLSACMYVCMNVCMYVAQVDLTDLITMLSFLHVCMYVCMYICLCTFACIYVCMYVCMYVCIRTYEQTMYVYILLCICICMNRKSSAWANSCQ